MKKLIAILIVLMGVAMVGKSLMAPRNTGEFDLLAFGRLPVVVNGRVKPLDTVARTALLSIQGRQRVSTPEQSEPFVETPVEWLAQAAFNQDKADTYPIFKIDSIELQTLLGFGEAETRVTYESGVKRFMSLIGFLPATKSRFSFLQLKPKIEEIQRQARLAGQTESALRTPFQKAVLTLYNNVGLYFRLKSSLVAPDHRDFLSELMAFQKTATPWAEALRAKQDGKPFDAALADQALEAGDRYYRMSELAYLLPIPPASGEADTSGWQKVGDSLLSTFRSGRLDSSTLVFAGLARTWRAGQAKEFNELLRLYHDQLEKSLPNSLKKSAVEARYNAAEPFYNAMMLYMLAFFVAVFSWLAWPEQLGRAAFWLVALAWLVATVGIGMRMWLEGRPPVTNLYSSALFVGWVAVAACLVLERFFRNGVGSVAAGLTGFCTLLIAYYLSLDGDTLEMMRAVLDSNFWLATHVVTVTAGYGATFLAGFLGLIYVFMGVFTPWLARAPNRGGVALIAAATLSPAATAAAARAAKTSQTNGQMLDRMIYGTVCFATLFSLVGTVLGGIWADQSWGRFWGWDPKENGALIIVIWNAIFLHARWGGMAKARGLAALAIFGNVVTAWSWFGVNMLGVGLHSYGFMDAAFWALLIFAASQVAIIALATFLPQEKWRSFRPIAPAAPVRAEEKVPVA